MLLPFSVVEVDLEGTETGRFTVYLCIYVGRVMNCKVTDSQMTFIIELN